MFAGLQVEVTTVGFSIQRRLCCIELIFITVGTWICHIKFALPLYFLLGYSSFLIAVYIFGTVAANSCLLTQGQVIEGAIGLCLTRDIDCFQQGLTRGIKGYIQVERQTTIHINILLCSSECV